MPACVCVISDTHTHTHTHTGPIGDAGFIGPQGAQVHFFFSSYFFFFSFSGLLGPSGPIGDASFIGPQEAQVLLTSARAVPCSNGRCH